MAAPGREGSSGPGAVRGVGDRVRAAAERAAGQHCGARRGPGHGATLQRAAGPGSVVFAFVGLDRRTTAPVTDEQGVGRPAARRGARVGERFRRALTDAEMAADLERITAEGGAAGFVAMWESSWPTLKACRTGMRSSVRRCWTWWRTRFRMTRRRSSRRYAPVAEGSRRGEPAAVGAAGDLDVVPDGPGHLRRPVGAI